MQDLAGVTYGARAQVLLLRALVYLALPLLVLVNAWWFPQVTGVGYLQWYLSNGALISLALGFLALVWEDLEEREGLLSASPVVYLRACLLLAGVLLFSVGTHLRNPIGSRDESQTLTHSLALRWDELLSTVLGLGVGLITIAWIVVIAPLVYLTTLVAGAPARMALRGKRRRAILRTSGMTTLIEEALPSDPSLPEPAGQGAVDVSFGRKPFALTQALSAAVLALAALLLA